MAMKAFAMPAVFPLMRQSLDGTTASGPYEARLGKEEFGKEVHVYAPAYTESTLKELLHTADHIYFNSVTQMGRFLPAVRAAGWIKRSASASTRVIQRQRWAVISMIPVHRAAASAWSVPSLTSLIGMRSTSFTSTPCANPFMMDPLVLINHVAGEFAPYINRVKAVNFGGGHFINKQGYDIETLINAIKDFRTAFRVEVILEPGSGLVVDAGYLVATVLDIVHNEKAIAILDASASCHMPDVLEVPYTPPLYGAASPAFIPIPTSLAAIPAWRAMSSANILSKSP